MPSSIRELGIKLLKRDYDNPAPVSEKLDLTVNISWLCSIVTNGYFPLKYGYNIDYKDV